jgi:hypothetical protein
MVRIGVLTTVLLKNRTLHRVGAHRITFGAIKAGLEFRISDQGGGFISGSVKGSLFLATACGTCGPDSVPVFTPQRREALGRALTERTAGGGTALEDREDL